MSTVEAAPLPDGTSNSPEGPEGRTAARPVAARLVLKLIWCYQHFISPWTPPSCRFYPTCSHYTYQAIERFGLWRGAWLGLARVCRCHPFHAGGYDPVPVAWPRRGQPRQQPEDVENV